MTAINNSEKKTESSSNQGLIFILVIAVVFLSIGGFWIWDRHESIMQRLNTLESMYEDLTMKLNDYNEKLTKIENDTKQIRVDYFWEDFTDGLVDFTTPKVQDIGNGFYVVQAEQLAHLNGIKFKGRVINTQAVDHTSLSFQIAVKKQKKSFSINKISSGNSTGFSVYIPDISASDSQYAKVKYESSSVSYFTR